MRIIFPAFLFLLPFISNAQDSCHLKRETDPFTHQTRISTGFIPFAINGMQVSISVDATNTDVDFFFWIQNDSRCFDDASTAQVNYDGDRLRATFRNSGSMNCQGAFHFIFKNAALTPSNLERLTSKKVKSIKLTGPNNTITDLVFSEEQKAKLMLMAGCVVREAKSLVGK